MITPGPRPPRELVPFTAQTRMSGIDLPRRRAAGRSIRKGAADSVRAWVKATAAQIPGDLAPIVEQIAGSGGTPLVVADGARVLGVIHLKDTVKQGMIERFAQLREMGIRTVMITGDNPLTAKAIAAEAGVDDFLAEATPEDKLALIRREQRGGHMVAMTGDGTNDAPALAQADVGLAMNTGTQAAKEAGNMVDLDSNPTKLIEVVEVAKQLLITRGSLTTFSIANDVAKYFAIIPAMFVVAYPKLRVLNVMHLDNPHTAILVRGHLQRGDHPGADPARPARGEVQAARRRRDPAPQHAHLRRRRHHRAVRLHQAHRPDPRRDGTALMLQIRLPAAGVGRHRRACRRSPWSLGFGYPLVVTGISQLFFRHQANGSLVYSNGKLIGSALLGQNFTDARATRCPGTSSPARPRVEPVRRRRLRRRQPGPVQPGAHQVCLRTGACLPPVQPHGSGRGGTGRRGDRLGVRTRSRYLGAERTRPGASGRRCPAPAGRPGGRARAPAHDPAAVGLPQ